MSQKTGPLDLRAPCTTFHALPAKFAGQNSVNGVFQCFSFDNFAAYWRLA
jgi:hypothetical protein